jgi:fructokinase
MAKSYWGIDLGGTKIEAVVLRSLEHPNPIIRKRIPTGANKGYQNILNQIDKLINEVSQEINLKPEQIGIGTPGSLDPITGTMKNSNTVCLNEQPLKKDLEKTFGIPVKMANDANCFALAEAKLGIVPQEMPHASVVFGVILGTGVGGGVVVNGKVLNGRQGIAGEWGHNFLDDSGGQCYCGKTGCVERVISGPALQRFYTSLTGQELNLKEILKKHYEKSDHNASLTIERLINNFGKAIANVINILDPDAIVIGGGVGNIPELYSQGVGAAQPHIFNTRFDTRFLKPALGDSAGVFGAAMLNS